MNYNPFLFVAFCISILVILYLVARLRRVRGQLMIIEEVLDDIKNGNPNRRVLARKSDMTKRMCYLINEIAVENQLQLLKQKQSEQAYKRLMTSLSHDVKTPLASLVGYLEAVENGFVTGEEKENYILVAVKKAYQLKHFVENLFEWVKLDAKEQVFHFELCDINELTRNIAAEWISDLESSHFEYEFDIPENECCVCVDSHAYTRILNNLFQNTLIHSGGNKLNLQLLENEKQVEVIFVDNGKGISDVDIPHVFERMYQCDSSRFAEGNGLGLSITKELVDANKGKIEVDSECGKGTTFRLLFQKAL